MRFLKNSQKKKGPARTPRSEILTARTQFLVCARVPFFEKSRQFPDILGVLRTPRSEILTAASDLQLQVACSKSDARIASSRPHGPPSRNPLPGTQGPPPPPQGLPPPQAPFSTPILLESCGRCPGVLLKPRARRATVVAFCIFVSLRGLSIPRLPRAKL